MMCKPVCMLMLSLVVLPLSVAAQQQRQIPIVVEAHTVSDTLKGNEPLLVVDISKWQIVDGWIPDKYKVTVRADNISLDEYTVASVMSDPVEVVIK